jgi:hypothetical protein
VFGAAALRDLLLHADQEPATPMSGWVKAVWVATRHQAVIATRAPIIDPSAAAR